MRTTHILALCATAVLVAHVPMLAQREKQNSTSHCGCMPTPKDMVSLDGLADYPDGKTEVTIYKVPRGRQFVMTDIYVRGANVSDLFQRKGGKDVMRISSRFFRTSGLGLGSSRTGLVFPSGALLVFKVPEWNDQEAAYHIRGHLTDE